MHRPGASLAEGVSCAGRGGMIRPSASAAVSSLLVCVIMLLLHGRGASAFQRLVGRCPSTAGARLEARRAERGSFVHRIRIPSALGGAASASDGPFPVRYEHEAIEPKWQKYWADKETFKAVRRPGKGKKYVLDMFPYPSGSGLHVGHPEGYTASDVMARYWRMCDLDVLHPMGWDSFGLPAEQHAINTGTHPGVTTYENIANFKRQLKSLGFSYDWSRELATTDYEYVRWTQWIFLQLYKKGLAEQSSVSVNWCPALGTVLANEEIINGKSERGDHPVERLPLRQWVLKITNYAEELEKDLEGLQWPEGTMTAQKLWIGRSEGAKVVFPLAAAQEGKGEVEVFTTRPDTLMGVTYVVLAPEHPLVDQVTTEGQRAAVKAYVKESAGKSDLDRTATGKDKGKTGVDTGATVVHPISGEELPVWVADYVLWGYGTGAVMAVPAHDERDHAFAKIFNLPIKQVVAPEGDVETSSIDEEAFAGEGKAINSGPLLDGLVTAEAKKVVVQELEKKSRGAAVINYRLRDWVFSRQRYWGEPIPIYFPVDMPDHEKGDPRNDDPHTIRYDQPIAVEESELPLKLPEMDNFAPGNDPQGCLARAKDWRYFKKPDGKWYARETNTMPQWAGSCWYYLRFTDPTNTERAWSEEADRDWLPVDLYVGGQEHAVLHLLYARFWHKFLFDEGLTKHKEPFQKLVHQGMILGSDGEKMSKSRGNVVNPDDVVSEYGGDALRLYEMFMGPLEAVKPWQTAQVAGVVRFRDKVYQLVKNREMSKKPEAMDNETLRLMHKTIKKVTQDVETLSFNTAISTMMIFANHLSAIKGRALPRAAVENLVLLVSPFAPHLGEECWELLGHQKSLSSHAWPQYQEELTVDDVVTLGVQVNGKTRGGVSVAVDAKEADVMALATAQEKVAGFLEGKNVVKVIYVPGRILNIVVK